MPTPWLIRASCFAKRPTKSDSGTRASLEKQADDLLDKVKEIKQKASEKASKS